MGLTYHFSECDQKAFEFSLLCLIHFYSVLIPSYHRKEKFIEKDLKYQQFISDSFV